MNQDNAGDAIALVLATVAKVTVSLFTLDFNAVTVSAYIHLIALQQQQSRDHFSVNKLHVNERQIIIVLPFNASAFCRFNITELRMSPTMTAHRLLLGMIL